MTRSVSSASSRLARGSFSIGISSRVLLREHGAIEHAGERRQALVVQALLEQRPAVFVEALRQERGLVALGHHVS